MKKAKIYFSCFFQKTIFTKNINNFSTVNKIPENYQVNCLNAFINRNHDNLPKQTNQKFTRNPFININKRHFSLNLFSTKNNTLKNDSFVNNKIFYIKSFCNFTTKNNNNIKENNQKSFELNDKSNEICYPQVKIKKYNPELLDKQTNLFNLIDKLPEKIQLFLKLGRYDRPIGYMLLFYPCAWGLTLGTPFLDYNYIYNLFLFFSGSVLMRSSGCIINDMWDKNIDKLVERSKTRPLAAGFLTMIEAGFFLAGHLALSLIILLQLPFTSIAAGLAVMPIVCIYPYMKRITHLPQVFLGISFNSGVIVGYPAFQGIFDIGIVGPFYLGGILWTLIYDTVYAHMDKMDDKKINVKSTALLFGDKSKFIFYILNILMLICFYIGMSNYSNKHENNINITNKENNLKDLYLNKNTADTISKINDSKIIINDINKAGYDIKDNIFKFTFTNLILGLGCLYQIYLIKKVNLNEPISCLKSFKRNSFFGFIIFVSCLCIVYERDFISNKKNLKSNISA